VTFDIDMRDHPYLGGVLDPRNYTLVEDATSRRLPVFLVRRISSTEVDLYTEELVATAYTLTVKKAESSNGDVVDPANDTAQFTGAPTTFPAGTELHSFYGLEAGFQSDNATGVDPDVSGPVVTAIDPVAGAALASKSTNIQLTIVDVETGVVASSVDLDVEINGGGKIPIWRGSAGGEQPAFAATTETPIANGFDYVINPHSDLPDGATVIVYAKATNSSTPVATTTDTSYQFKVFDKFGVMTLVQTGDLELTATFKDPMRTTGAEGAALIDAASYQLNSLGAGVAATISAVTFVSASSVKFTLAGGPAAGITTRGEQYQVEVLSALVVVDSSGDTIAGALGNYISATSLPRITKIESLSANRIRVTFSRDMQDNVDLIDVSKYRFSEGLFAASVTRTSSTTVEVTTSRQLEGRSYSLTVFP
jgi:hypothetical protein